MAGGAFAAGCQIVGVEAEPEQFVHLRAVPPVIYKACKDFSIPCKLFHYCAAVEPDLVVDLVMVAVFALQAAELLALPPAQGRSALQAAAPALLFDDVCHVVWSV